MTQDSKLQTAPAAAAIPQESQAAPSSLAGWIIPGLADWAFVAVLGWLFWAQAGAASLLGDGDAGWHIRLGEIVLSTGHLPTTDPFSFSMAGKVWFAWEWLSDVIFALAHRADGLQGVVLLAGGVIALTAALLVRYMLWLRVNTLAALLGMFLICSVSSVHWLARPHMFTWGFLVATLWLLESDRRKQTWKLWLLAPMGVAWTNMHGGWVALIVTTGIFAVGTTIEDLWKAGWKPQLPASTKRYGLLVLLCAAASVVNPYGFELHRHIGDYLQSDFILTYVQEFQSPSFRNESMRVLEVIIFASFFVGAHMLRRGEVARPLLMAAWAHACLTSVRHAPLFAIVAVPYITLELTRLIDYAAANGWSLAGVFRDLGRDYGAEGNMASERGPAVGWLAAAGIVVVAFTLNARAAEPKWKAEFPAVRFPAAAVEALGERLSHERVLTSDQWGDYLIYRLYPNYLTFIDGRSDFYDSEIRGDYLEILGSTWKVNQVIEKYGFRAALLPLDWTITTALKQSPNWEVVYDDGFAVYLERKGLSETPRTAAVTDSKRGPSSSKGGGLESEGILLGSLK